MNEDLETNTKVSQSNIELGKWLSNHIDQKMDEKFEDLNNQIINLSCELRAVTEELINVRNKI